MRLFVFLFRCNCENCVRLEWYMNEWGGGWVYVCDTQAEQFVLFAKGNEISPLFVYAVSLCSFTILLHCSRRATFNIQIVALYWRGVLPIEMAIKYPNEIIIIWMAVILPTWDVHMVTQAICSNHLLFHSFDQLCTRRYSTVHQATALESVYLELQSHSNI